MDQLCPTCKARKGSEDCPACKGRGTIKLTMCPLRYVGDDLLEGIRLVQDADKGAWPLGNGTLNESDSFLQLRSAWHAATKRAGVDDEHHG